VTGPIRTVLADDEVLARRTLRELLGDAGDIEVVTECRDGIEAVRAIDQLAPELVFLDIQMPGLDGFGALSRAAAVPVIVFVTAHERHAVRAFDVDAADYLVKPFNDERFHRAVVRARVEVQRRRLVALVTGLIGDPPPGAQPADRPGPGPGRFDRPGSGRLVVKDGPRVELIDVAEIHCIRADGYYAELQLADRTVLVREPLQDLEDRLDPERFVRIHRSAIVNVARICRVERAGHGVTVVLHGGARLAVSRGRRSAIDRVLRGR